MSDENRVKLLCVDPQTILNMLPAAGHNLGVIDLSFFGELPADAVADSAHFDYATNRFRMRVYSEEFPVVDLGEYPPRLDNFDVYPVRLYRVDETTWSTIRPGDDK